MRNLLIVGASRGLGRALAEGVPEPGDTLFLVARMTPDLADVPPGVTTHWIEADLLDPTTPARIAAELGTRSLDAFLYNAGIWETGWTTTPFERVPADELRDIVIVNLTAPMLCAQAVLPHLRASAHGKVVLIGSTCGWENEGSPLVGTAGSKFGLRGVAHALREIGRPDGITVTCLSPGTLATETPLRAGADPVIAQHGTRRIPVGDIVELVRTLLRLSPAACVKEILVPATGDVGI
jgi:NAD(P)-dependent dehydrogenase (short-subunit alcohol dehydrogenase family)